MKNIGIPDTPIDPEVVALAQQYGNRRDSLLAIFQALQVKHGGLTDKIISDVARVLHLTPAQAYGVASFYAMLSTHIGPPHTIRLCDSPPCWLRGAAHIHATLEATRGQGWTVTRTSCLGLCDRAPAALVDMQPCGPLTPERVPDSWTGWRGDMPSYQQPLPGEVRVLLAHAGALGSLLIGRRPESRGLSGPPARLAAVCRRCSQGSGSLWCAWPGWCWLSGWAEMAHRRPTTAYADVRGVQCR